MQPQGLGAHRSPEIAQTCDIIWRSTLLHWMSRSATTLTWWTLVPRDRPDIGQQLDVSSRFFHESPGSDRGSERFIETFSPKSWQRSRLGLFHRDFFTKVLAAMAARNVSSRFVHESPGSDRGLWSRRVACKGMPDDRRYPHNPPEILSRSAATRGPGTYKPPQRSPRHRPAAGEAF